MRFLPFLFLFITLTASAQDEALPVVTRTTAITNAHIIQAPGRVIERGTVVMRNGLIVAVGSDVEVPYDAEIVDGDSLTVYAGFVDGLSHAGLSAAEAPKRPARLNAADPPADFAGLQPDRNARELLSPTDTLLTRLRAIGFTAAHVVPRGKMLPGGGSIILLAGESPEEMVLMPDVSQFMQFESGTGVYPNTQMGVMAQLRQLLREAKRRERIQELYEENPSGMERPVFDPVHEALYDVARGEKPLFILADGLDSALEVHRALQLRDELEFSLALAGLHQGFDVADDLKGQSIPLFLALGLPRAETDTTSVELMLADSVVVDTTDVIAPEQTLRLTGDLRTATYEEIGVERENLSIRQKIERQRYYGSGARLRDAGLRFGVTSVGSRVGEIREHIRKMIDAGLPEDAALAALTVDGARLLGIDRILGTVEEGKMANLVVTKGSYFDPKSPVQFVFVNGRKFEVTPTGSRTPERL